MTDSYPTEKGDYTRWGDDTPQSYALRIASNALWEVGHLLCQIGDKLLDAAYPNTSVEVNMNEDAPDCPGTCPGGVHANPETGETYCNTCHGRANPDEPATPIRVKLED